MEDGGCMEDGDGKALSKQSGLTAMTREGSLRRDTDTRPVEESLPSTFPCVPFSSGVLTSPLKITTLPMVGLERGFKVGIS